MLDDDIRNKHFFSVFINQIDCALIYLSATGSIEIANNFAIQLLQLDPHQYVGTNIRTFCQNHNYLLCDFFDSAKNSPQPIEESHEIEGKEFSISWKIVSLHTVDHELNGSLLVGYNVTPCKMVSEELNRKVVFYENILSKLPTNVYWKDKNSVYMGCNERLANVMGLPSRDAIEGMTDFDFPWSKEAAESFIAFDKKVMRSGEPSTTEDVFEEASGKVVTVLTNKTPLKNEADETVGVLAISVDITELKQTQAQLEVEKQKAEASSHAKSEFIANMSHDIRTPLSGIMSIFEFLSGQLAENSEEKELAQDGLDASNRLMKLSNEIIELTRYEFGFKPESNEEGFVLKKDILDDIYALFRPAAKEKKLDFKFEIGEGIPSVLIGNRQFIHRIVLNLVGNAMKFTKTGSITILCSAEDRHDKNLTLKIAVKDTGIGIPEDKREVIFDIFSRLTSSYQGIYKGSGLGLYIVKLFLSAINGTIKVESNEGEGSTFICKIPVRKGTLDDIQNRLLEPSSSLNYQPNLLREKNQEKEMEIKKNIRILLVEDELLAQKLSTMIMRQMNYEVDVAKNGQEALEKFQNNQYHLVFMDIGLDTDGYLVTQKIREWEKQQGKDPVPIVAQTAHLDLTSGELALESGMNEIIQKPLNQTIIEQVVESFVQETKTTNNDPVIDFELATQITGHRKIAEETLKLLGEIIEEERSLIELAYLKQDWTQLKFLIHKLHGSTSYCGVPRLKEACYQLEEGLSEGNINQIDILYENLLVELDMFSNEYKKFF